MEILDNLEEIKKLDSLNALGSIQNLPDQADQVWQELKDFKLSEDYLQFKNIIVAGMGASSYGGRIIASVFPDKLKTPLILVNDYHLPNFVEEETLVLLSSFSGSTEEVLSVGQKAKERKAKILGICSGGALSDFLKENSCPGYIFNPKFNPANQPRLGQGYMITGQIMLLRAAGAVAFAKEQMEAIISQLKTNVELYGTGVPEKSNKAKQAARFFYNSLPILMAGSFLDGSCYAVRNPINENSKNMGFYFVIPELNHHLLEGLQFPKSNQDNLKFLMIDSDFYSPEIKKRFNLTLDVIAKNGLKTQLFKLQGKDQLTQAVELVHFGNWVSFYLAVLNNVDPSPIPWVDYFKKRMLD